MSIYKGSTRVAGIGATHSHSNKTVIDKFSENASGLVYNGAPIAGATYLTKQQYEALNPPVPGQLYGIIDWSPEDSVSYFVTLEVTTTGWTEDTTSQTGTTLYKKQIDLINSFNSSPDVSIGAASGDILPTTAQQKAYDLLKYVTIDDTVPCLYLYASAVPETAFYINVQGVNYSGILPVAEGKIDEWTDAQTVSNSQVTFTGLDDIHGWGYKPYIDITSSSTNKNPNITINTITGSGTANMSITYDTDADNGSSVKLRIIK